MYPKTSSCHVQLALWALLYLLLYIPPSDVVLRESMSTVRARAHSILKLRGLTMHRWFDYKKSRLRMWRRKARRLKKQDEQGIGEVCVVGETIVDWVSIRLAKDPILRLLFRGMHRRKLFLFVSSLFLTILAIQSVWFKCFARSAPFALAATWYQWG